MLIKQITKPEFMIELRQEDADFKCVFSVIWKRKTMEHDACCKLFNLDAALFLFDSQLQELEGQ